MPADSVIVVGAGTVGLTSALELAQRGWTVTVVEREDGPDPGPRDHAYNWPILPELARIGVLDDAVAAGAVIREWGCRDLRTGEHIAFDYGVLADDTPYPFNLNLPHERMVALLTDRLGRHSGAAVRWSTEVTGFEQDASGVTVAVRDRDGADQLRAAWLVGADGARSTVRRTLGLGLAGMTWTERLIAADIRADLAAAGHAPRTYLLDPEGGALTALLAEPDLWRFVVAEGRSLPVEGMHDRLAERLSRVLPVVGDAPVLRVDGRRIHERAVETMRVGRVLLAGDAAHLTNPTLGLGMTAGLFDAAHVAEALSAVVDGREPEDTLDRYSETRLRAFWDDIVPPSSEAKSLLFPSSAEVSRFDDALDVLREASAEPALQREFLLRLAGTPAPSVLL